MGSGSLEKRSLLEKSVLSAAHKKVHARMGAMFVVVFDVGGLTRSFLCCVEKVSK